jgi:hypothetical protein
MPRANLIFSLAVFGISLINAQSSSSRSIAVLRLRRLIKIESNLHPSIRKLRSSPILVLGFEVKKHFGLSVAELYRHIQARPSFG